MKNQSVSSQSMQSIEKNVQKRIGVILVQLGTPDEATPQAVRTYLKEFLSDPHVIEINKWLWKLILNGIILRTRPKKSALLYQRLFQTYGPVLKIYSESLAKKIATDFKEYSHITIDYGMRYGNPSLKAKIEQFVLHDKVTHLMIVPLFPQYSNATTGSVYDLAQEVLSRFRFKPALHLFEPFYCKAGYIASTAELINSCIDSRATPPEKLILSYHGLPQSYSDRGDPYHEMCLETTKLLSEVIHLPKENILHTYQSRFGNQKWLEPALDITITELAKLGTDDIIVACPAFSMDCLETLDEVGYEARKLFIENGGERFELVSCLNDTNNWATALSKMIFDELNSWL